VTVFEDSRWQLTGSTVNEALVNYTQYEYCNRSGDDYTLHIKYVEAGIKHHHWLLESTEYWARKRPRCIEGGTGWWGVYWGRGWPDCLSNSWWVKCLLQYTVQPCHWLSVNSFVLTQNPLNHTLALICHSNSHEQTSSIS